MDWVLAYRFYTQHLFRYSSVPFYMVEAGKPAGALDENPFPPIRYTCVIFGIRLGYFLLQIKVEEMLDFLVAVILSFDPLVRVHDDCSDSCSGFVLIAVTEAAYHAYSLALWGQELEWKW